MIARFFLGLLVLVGLAGFLGIGYVTLAPTRSSAPAPAPVQLTTTAVIAAAHPLSAGAMIKPDDIAVIQIARGAVPTGALPDNPEARMAVVGAMARRPVASNAPIIQEDLLKPGDHGFLAAVLRPGKRAVTVAVDAVSGSAGLIWPGDTVDVILTQQIDAPDLAPGRRVVAETVLEGARVIAIDQHLAGGPLPGGTSAQAARTVTLEVGATEAEKVQVAARIGRLSLAVRSSMPGAPATAAGNDPKTAPTWASDVSNALSSKTQTQGPSVMKVFNGAGEGKEFKF